MRKKHQLIGCVALSSVLLAGCGEDDKQAATPEPSKPEVEAVADPVEPLPERQEIIEQTADTVDEVINEVADDAVTVVDESVEKAEETASDMVESAETTAEEVVGAAEEQAAAVEEEVTAMAEEVTEEKPVDGEAVYAGLCFSCHQSGLMEAPIMGDAAAWAPRVAQGTEALYQSAINGKNLMPAKGGNPGLSDEEVKAAVDYMLSKLP